MTNADFLAAAAVDCGSVERSFESAGREISFRIRKLSALRDYRRLMNAIKSRCDALKAYGGRLPVEVDAETIERLSEHFPDAERRGDAMVAFVTDEAEIDYATVLELGLEEPNLSWAEAVVFQRINGRLAVRVCREFYKLNTETLRSEAKNG